MPRASEYRTEEFERHWPLARKVARNMWERYPNIRLAAEYKDIEQLSAIALIWTLGKRVKDIKIGIAIRSGIRDQLFSERIWMRHDREKTDGELVQLDEAYEAAEAALLNRIESPPSARRLWQLAIVRLEARRFKARDRRILRLTLEGKSAADIAPLVGVDESTVRRSRRRMARRIQSRLQ